ncbi:hypothetical protein DFH06DRAFT_1013602 [Mycena polygramma]|nr:hypothetical protein DFH06DRAFT_1013602 [Mycena polygramma]
MYTPRTEKRVLNERVQQMRRGTLAKKTHIHHTMEEEKEQLRRTQVFDAVLEQLKSNGYTMAEFTEYVFDPDTKLNSDWRWKGFFAQRGIVERIFGFWTTSRYNASTRQFMQDWATRHVAKSVSSESRSITRSGVLSKLKKVVNEKFFLDFSLAGLTSTLRERAPVAFQILDAFSTTTRQLREGSENFLARKEMMKGAAALTLLRGASRHNSYAQFVNSTYLAATGAPRQHYSVLGLYGVSVGYTSMIARGTLPLVQKNRRKRKRARAPGMLNSLHDACMTTARAVAESRLIGLVYDNLNLMARVAEQILGRKNAQENGTCATVFALHNAKRENMLTTDLDEAILKAPPLRLNDILFDAKEAAFFAKNMVHTILRIIVRQGGEGFNKWETDLDASQPVSEDTIDVHQTQLYPLPTMEIDESSITGNVEVMEEITKVLGFDVKDPEYAKYVQIVAGDQLTIARQRSILNVRLGHESGAQSWKHVVLMPGLFHAKIADCHGLLETHFGKPNAGTRSPGSLGFHNTVLDRLPITLTSLPPFRTCRDLIMVSLYSRVLHCLLLVSGHDSLEEYAAKVDSWATVVCHAEQIYETYADADHVQELRERRVPDERKQEMEAKAAKKAGKDFADPIPHIRKGDMVFENAVLFLRDALLTREFTDAIKAGDSGRILLILRMWAFCYRGSGRSKYAHEMLHLLHNILCVWPKELRNIVLQNWLANPQGKLNCFVEIDLVQEHLNFWIKKVYKADGAGHSWDWLALVSPCIDVLRKLATQINTDLGSRQGAKHTIPGLEDDIATLMDSLDEHEVYIEKEGRVLDDDEKPVPDVLSVGMAALTHGASITPLEEFNRQFNVLRERRRLTPIADLLLVNTPGTNVDPPTSSFASEDVDLSDASAEPDFDLDDVDPEPREEEAEMEDEDLFATSPTLTRDDAGDVALDMDVEEWYLDEGEESDSDYSDEDEDGAESS